MRRLTRFLACFLAAVLVISNLQYVGVKAVEVEEITVDAEGAEDEEDITQTFNFSELEKYNNGSEGMLNYTDDIEAGTTTIEYGALFQSLFVKIPATVDVKTLKEVRFEVNDPGSLAYKLYTNEKFETDKHTGDAAVSYGIPTLSASSVQDRADLGYVVLMSMVESGTIVVSKVTFVTAKPISKTYTATDLENTSDDGVTVTEKDGKLVIEYPAINNSVYFALPRNVNGKTLKKVSFDLDSVKTITVSDNSVSNNSVSNNSVSNNSVSENSIGNIAFKIFTDEQYADPEKPSLAVGWGNPEVAVPSTTDPVTHIAITSIDKNLTAGQKLRVVLNGFSFTFAPDGTEDRYIEEDVPSLYQEVEKDSGISMGVAVPVTALDDDERMKLVYKHYNSLTCENEMKPDTILGSAEPNDTNEDGNIDIDDIQLNFNNADTMMDAVVAANEAGDANLKVRGNVFVWHAQTPTWFFREGLKSSGAYVTPEEMNKRMEWYIKSVAEHFDTKYQGLIYAWDVVNEAANDDGGPRTNSDWYNVYQSWDYIPKAFEYADKYLDEDTILFYNDYNECTPTKRDQIVEFLTEIKKHISEDRTLGAGMQGHYDMATPTLEMIEAATRAYAAAADVVHVTELDIKSTMGYVDSPEARVAEYTKQGHRYKEIYNMIKRVNAETGNKVKNITIWGTDDSSSWLNTSNSVGGSADGKTSQFPLLFDDNLKVKPSYWAFVDQTKLDPFINAVNSMNTDDPEYTFENVAMNADGTAWYTFKTYWSDGKLYFWVDDTVAGKDVKLYTDIDADGTPEGPVAFEDGVAFVDAKDISVNQTYLFDIVVDGKAYNDTKGTYAETSKYYAKVTTKPLMKVTKGTACVDGDASDWSDVPSVSLDVVYVNPQATAEAKVCWDEEKLYVLMNVKDENLDATGIQDHDKDCIEIFIDELNEQASSYDNNDKHYRINYLNEQSFNGATCTAANIDSAVQLTDDGYVVEAAIKWTALSAKGGEMIGFDLLLCDGKDGVRIGTRNWYDASGNGYQNPGVFGTAVLVDDGSTSEADAAKAKVAEDAAKAIGTVSYTEASKAKIDAAVAAYDDLTVAQRLLTKDAFATIKAAQATYEKLEAAAKEAAKDVTDKINAIGEVVYDATTKAKIDEARKAYDALTDEEKNLVPSDVLKILTDAETTYNAADEEHKKNEAAVKDVTDKINAIGDVLYDTTTKAKIDEARKAYDALTNVQKDLVSSDVLKILSDAETAYSKAEEEQKKIDEAAAKDVTDKINAIGEVLYDATTKAKIDEARKAYDALTNAQKDLVSSDVLKILTDAESTYNADEEEHEKNLAAVKEVTDKINAIGDVVYDSSIKAKIDEARKTYDALTDVQKDLVPSDVLEILTDAETAYSDAEEEHEENMTAVKEVTDKINAIGDVTYDASAKAKIDKARKAYNALTNAQKDLVSSDVLKILTDAETAYSKAKEEHEKNVAAVEDVIDKIDALEFEDIVYDATIKAMIDEARKAYDALTDVQKKLVPSDVLDTLIDSETTYREAEKEYKENMAAVKNVIDKINAIGEVVYDETTKAKIDEARDAYEALTEEQQDLVPSDILDMLIEAEDAYDEAEEEANEIEYFAKFSIKSIPIKVGQTSTALAKDIQIAEEDEVVKWKSSNPKVVSVNKKTGKIKGLKVGKATITAYTESGLKASIKVVVQKEKVSVVKVSLTNKATGKAIKSKSTVTLKKGKKMTIVANVIPMTTTQKVKFSSSNRKVASVTSKGVIKAKKKGTTTITAKVDKKTFKFKVKVK